jgi:hypothetical protein
MLKAVSIISVARGVESKATSSLFLLLEFLLQREAKKLRQLHCLTSGSGSDSAWREPAYAEMQSERKTRKVFIECDRKGYPCRLPNFFFARYNSTTQADIFCSAVKYAYRSLNFISVHQLIAMVSSDWQTWWYLLNVSHFKQTIDKGETVYLLETDQQ